MSRYRQLKADFEDDEGNRGDMYDDANGRKIKPSTKIKGQASIGIGHNLHARDLTPGEVDHIFKNDLRNAIRHALAEWPWIKLENKVRQDAFINLVFNMGNRLHQFDRGSLRKWRAGDHQGAAEGFRGSKWARDVQPSRRDRVTFMIEFGVRPD